MEHPPLRDRQGCSRNIAKGQNGHFLGSREECSTQAIVSIDSRLIERLLYLSKVGINLNLEDMNQYLSYQCS